MNYPEDTVNINVKRIRLRRILAFIFLLCVELDSDIVPVSGDTSDVFCTEKRRKNGKTGCANSRLPKGAEAPLVVSLNNTNLASLLSKINARRFGRAFGKVIVMTDYKIDCVNKPNRNSPHEHITHVGGPKPDGSGRWKDTVPAVVKFIEAGTHRFYTSEGGASAWVGVADECRRQQVPPDSCRWRVEGQLFGADGMWVIHFDAV